MYHIKPVYNSQHLLADLPTSMYKMKPIYANSPTKSATASNGVVSQYCDDSIERPDIQQKIKNILKVHWL